MARVVFMGSPEEVIAPLEALLQEPSHQVLAVVSQPAKPVGRGGGFSDPPVAAFAKKAQLTCLQPESAKDLSFLSQLEALAPEIIVTAAYGQILSDAFLKIPSIATINIHPSRLPQYRGATPITSAILDGLNQTSVTVLFTVKKLDAGAIILQKDFSIGDLETSGALTLRLFKESAPILLEAISILEKNRDFKGLPQKEDQATHCKKITKEMGRIDWSKESRVIVNQFRAFEPWPGSWAESFGRRISMVQMTTTSGHPDKNLKPGQFEFYKPARALFVGSGQGIIQISRLKPAGGKEMDAHSFWNGLKNKDQAFFS